MWRTSLVRTAVSSISQSTKSRTATCCRQLSNKKKPPRQKPSTRNKVPPPRPTPPPPQPVDPRIQARPPGEKPVDTKFPLPDVEKEKELGTLQSQITDLYRSSQFRRALTLSQELLQTTRAHFGQDHPATASAHNNLGLLYKQLGEFDDSRAEYRKSLTIYKRVVGSDHASYAAVLHNLGTCARTQLHVDASLRATDRLSLLEESAQVLEQAYSIRVQELGPEHPHTVASLSSWGATLASQILSHYKKVGGSGSSHKSQDDSSNQNSNTISTNNNKWVSTVPSPVSEAGWQAAEQHLRQALQTAIDNPRGLNIHNKSSSNKKSVRTQAGKSHGAVVGTSVSSTSSSSSSTASDTKTSAIATLSAAAAAQNLAIVLKARAVTETPVNAQILYEAKDLYEQALKVRTQLLPSTSLDLYTTKYSLAEVLEALGDEVNANLIRQDILDTYYEKDESKEEDPAAVTETTTTTTTQSLDQKGSNN